jgi:hypothetical protein
MVRNLTRKEACPAGRNNTPLSETYGFYHKNNENVKGEICSKTFGKQEVLAVESSHYSPATAEKSQSTPKAVLRLERNLCLFDLTASSSQFTSTASK